MVWVAAIATSCDSPDRSAVPPEPSSSRRAESSVSAAKIQQVLVPKTMVEVVGEPPQEVGAELEKARAVQVAFHALLFGSGYELDYKDIRRLGADKWLLLFRDGSTVKELQHSLSNRIEFLDEVRRGLESGRKEVQALHQLARRLRVRQSPRLPHVTRKLRRETLKLRSAHREIGRFMVDIRDLREQITTRRHEGGPFDVEIIMRQGLSDVRVEAINTSSPRAGALRQAVGYSESTDAQVGGAEHYNAALVPSGRGNYRFETYGFWTGPIGSSFAEKCLLEIAAEGKVLWRQPPHLGPYEKGPPSEDGRDQWVTSQRVDGLEKPVARVSGRYRCRARW